MSGGRKTLLPTPNYGEAWGAFRREALASTGYAWSNAPSAFWKEYPGDSTNDHQLSTRLPTLQKRKDFTVMTNQQRTTAPLRRVDFARRATQPSRVTQNKTPMRVITDNKDFEQIIRSVYKKCQLSHHTEVWKEVPLSIKRQLSVCFNFITPPCPDEDLKIQLTEIQNMALNNILQVVQSHINKQLVTTNKKLQEVNPLDASKAIVIAKRQLQRNLRKKVSDKDLSSWLDEASHTLEGSAINGSDGKSPPITLTPSTANKTPYQPQQIEESETNKMDMEVTETIHTTTKQKRKRHLSSPVWKTPSISTTAETPVKRNRIETTPIIVSNDYNSTNEQLNELSPKSPCQRKRVKHLEVPECTKSPPEKQDSSISSNTTNVLEYNDESEEEITEHTLKVHSPSMETMSKEGETTLSPLSVKSSLTGKKIIHFLKTNELKKSWKLTAEPHTKTIVIADSNLRLACNIPTEWEIHVYPGMTFKHTNEVLVNFKPAVALENIIVIVGINHRTLNYNKTSLPDMNKLWKTLNIFSTKTVFLSAVSTSNNLSQEEASNIRQINDKMKVDCGKRFVPPLASPQVKISPNDILKIHHSKETVDKIISQLNSFITNYYLN